MDRNRQQGKRQGKTKGPIPGDLVALGAKSRPEDVKNSSASQARKTSTSTVKRDSPSTSSGSGLVPKRTKPITQTFTALGRGSDSIGRGSPTTQVYRYDDIAKDVPGHEFLEAINEAEDQNDDEKIEGLLCGAVKYLKMNRAKPDPALYLSLMYLAKAKPTFFGSEVVSDAFSSLLKRDLSISFKGKGNALVSVLACNLLMTACQDEENWADTFVKVYMEDSLGERIWVDRSDCRAFVQNIQTAFNTKIPSSHLLQFTVQSDTPSSAGTSPAHVSGSYGVDDDSMDSGDLVMKCQEVDVSSLVFPRYTYQQVSIESYVLDVVREHLSRRQSIDSGNRNLLRLLFVTCGYSEVRSLSTPRIEMWLQNAKLTKLAQDLLLSICMNCDQHSQADIDVMSQLCKIRLKTKSQINHYLICVRELLSQHQENLGTLLHHTIYNELSNSKNPNNMTLISVMFMHDSKKAARILAEIFQNLLTNKDDYLRALRALLREIMRCVRQDMNFVEFTRGLIQDRPDQKFKDLDPQIKERLLFSLTDLVCLTALLSVTPTIREAAASFSRGDLKDVEVLRQFQLQVSLMQRDAIAWMQNLVHTIFSPKQQEFTHYLKKVLFVEKAEHYYKVDNWPLEADRNVLLRMMADVPVEEDTLMWLLLMGLGYDHRLGANEAVDLADQLIRRAAMLAANDFPVLHVKRLELVDALFNLCAYRHPENITLPKGYTPPTLAISALYWKAWIMLLVISAFNPSTFGKAAWENYPTLKCLMEMAMTSNFKFPPPTMTTDEKSVEEIRSQDKQMAELEKQSVLQFEGHLAAASRKVQITEANSLLMAQLTTMDPRGMVRRPPTSVLEQLRSLNLAVRLGHKLCSSRNPDFLLDIIQRQGPSESMPWLAELVESSAGSLDVLPVQCLCEFLLHENPEDDEDDYRKGGAKQKQKKQVQVLSRLQSLLHSDDCDPESLNEVLGYFLKRLSSQQLVNRQLAVKGLSMVLSRSQISEDDNEEMDADDVILQAFPGYHWLLHQLPLLPMFDSVKKQVCLAAREACEVDTDSEAVGAYIMFLAYHSKQLPLPELDELAAAMAQLIVARSTLMNHLLPQDGSSTENSAADLVLCALVDLFYIYLKKAQQPENEAFSWSDTQDQVLLKWETGETATMNILVVHSMIVLLTYGRPAGTSDFDSLLGSWFTPDGTTPSAYLVDTSEEALLFPDWLKLRMIRSNIDRLVDAALLDLDPAQLILFVQSFGIPVHSMTKLLHCLDQAMHVDGQSLQQVVIDKGYMAQLVEVQHMRGATGGEMFKDMLIRAEADKKPDESPVWPAMRTNRTKSQLTWTPVLTDEQHSIQHISTMLNKVFGCGGGDVVIDEKHKAFRLLTQSLSKGHIVHQVAESLIQLLNGSEKEILLNSMQKQLHQSCPLLRILISKKELCGGQLEPLMWHLHQLLAGSKSALASLVNNFKRQHLPQKQPKCEESQSKSAAELLKECVSVASCISHPKSESRVSRAVHHTLETEGWQRTTETVCELLAADNGLPRSTAGLLVDWLELLDPEMLAASPVLQQQLLFARQQRPRSQETEDNKFEKGPVSSQPYLLALLTHQASWSSIHKCINLLLSSQAAANYNPSAALDFLWACIHIPKIWQGRDKTLPKNHVVEDVLQLTKEQVISVADYMIAEAQGKGAGDKDSVSSDLQADAEQCLMQRLPLLVRCCCNKSHLVTSLVNHLMNKINETQPDQSTSHQLLFMVYTEMPEALKIQPAIAELSQQSNITKDVHCQLDVLSHRMLVTLGTTGPSKALENKMHDANIACRKLAAEHPIIMLRQLPMIAGLLQGRAHFLIGEMRHRNHIVLYTHVLGLLELLKPRLFNPEYNTSLDLILTSFFELVRIHGMANKHLASLVVKYISLLHNFMTHNRSRATKVLLQYIPLLESLTNHFRDLHTLRSLLAGLTLPVQNISEMTNSDDREATTEDKESSLVPPRPASPWSMNQLTPMQQRLGKLASTEDLQEALKDLDETSKRRVDILQHFVDDIKRLLLHHNEAIRDSAFTLAMRHCRHFPSSGSDLVPAFLRCLSCQDEEVAKTTLQNLPEICLLAQENSGPLLKQAFSIAINSKMEATTNIVEALQLLNMHSMT